MFPFINLVRPSRSIEISSNMVLLNLHFLSRPLQKDQNSKTKYRSYSVSIETPTFKHASPPFGYELGIQSKIINSLARF